MNTAPGSFLAGNLGVDSIGEFSVLTGNFQPSTASPQAA